jgi:tetratricopeptide (TPR) repeat protein
MIFMTKAFVLPLFDKSIEQIGFAILWIPAVIGGTVMILVAMWMLRPPWNLRKLVYGVLVFFVIAMGVLVLQYAKTRLLSVSFRLFTWISTWEMIRTEPLLGNGVGSFKAVYPAYRRPEIIVLEGKSNTETDHSENEYIEVWQDEGIFGFLIFLWLIITALTCGFKQLGWFSRIRGPTTKRNAFSLENDPRSYEVLGIMGAYMGALFHWCVDVSVRFVSSGVFSGLLPGLLVAYARNHDQPIRVEARLPYDRWIRLSVALVWTAVFLVLQLELVPARLIPTGYTSTGKIVFFCLLAGLFVYALLEILEKGLAPEKSVPFEDQYPPLTPSAFPLFARLILIGLLGIATLKALNVFVRFFQADVHHNLAIFFSKNAVWTKGARFDEAVARFPEDIRKHYREVGGALDHYEAVVAKNPGFPMAIYFTGNVYNDWGSQHFQESLQARARGDVAEANRLKERTLDMWNKSEAAYERLRKIAPNYVQMHHQLGLLYVKRAELYAQFGETEKVAPSYQTAYQHFMLYHQIDPVFPPNYDRLVHILLMDKNFDEAARLYKKAIHYNEDIAESIRTSSFADRVAELSTSLGKLLYTQAQHLASDPFNPRLSQVDEAIEYLTKAVENNPQSSDAWKALGFLQARAGLEAQSQESLRRALQLAPNDPELKRG